MTLNPMECKFCSELIDYDTDVKKAFKQGTKEIHNCPGLKDRPKKDWKKNWVKKEFKDQSEELAVRAEIKLVKDDLDSLENTVKGLVDEVVKLRQSVAGLSFQKGNGEDLG